MDLEQLRGLTIYPHSVVDWNDTSFVLVRSGGEKYLSVLGDATGFEGQALGPDPESLRLCPLTSVNAAVLRERLPWLRPVPLGLRPSAGFGDRLGLATPGHVRAARRA
ncbi:MAG: hypothetical protein DRI77_01525, partial [Chloroflexi bacterium]